MSGINDGTLYFDDLEIGLEERSPGRTVTEGDIVNFAGLSGDFNRLHTDDEYARQHSFGQRTAHGLLVLSIASGLTTRVVMYQAMEKARIALMELVCRWEQPVFVGDTVYVLVRIAEKRDSVSRPGTGITTLTRTVENQRGEVVMRSDWKMLMKMK